MRTALILAPVMLLATGAAAPLVSAADDPAVTQTELREALLARQAAEARSRDLERQAASARGAADRTARQAAALAAQIQQAEAGMAAAAAQTRLVEREQARLREALGRQQQPVMRLTAALQQFARRPVALAALRPGSVKDVVYLRAMLSSALPQVRARTEGLRGQLARMRLLRTDAQQAAGALRSEQAALNDRRMQLAALETRQRLDSRRASGSADREAERALALGEQARDLGALMSELDRAGSLRARLAALPGPLMRPARPDHAVAVPDNQPFLADAAGSAPRPYLLPVTGRTVAGYAAPGAAGASHGLTLSPRPGAQVVAPGAGRVAFAGPYRGYARIVIIEHAGGWTSLVTGLARVDVAVGDQLIAGAPLGIAAQAGPAITLELRQGTRTVNPLRFVG
ncbi:MAG: peptidoglycan DD-metalloendopeptidase family protein [Croceibacterium sp.]